MHRLARCAFHPRALRVTSTARITRPHTAWTRNFSEAFPMDKKIEKIVESIEPQDQEQIAAFLAIVPQNVTEFADKFNSWPHLLNASNRQLKAAGLNIKQRKMLLEKLEVYKSEHRRRTMISQLPTLNATASAVDAQQALFDVEYAHLYARQWRKAEEREAAHFWRQRIILGRMRKKWARNEWNGIQQSNRVPSLKPLRNPEAAKTLLKQEIEKLEQMVATGDDEIMDALDIIEDEQLNEIHFEPMVELLYDERRQQIVNTRAVDDYETSIIDATKAALPDLLPSEQEAARAQLDQFRNSSPEEYDDAKADQDENQLVARDVDAEIEDSSDDTVVTLEQLRARHQKIQAALAKMEADGDLAEEEMPVEDIDESNDLEVEFEGTERDDDFVDVDAEEKVDTDVAASEDGAIEPIIEQPSGVVSVKDIDINEHRREYLADVSDPLTDELFELGMPLKSYREDEPSDQYLEEETEARLATGETNAENIRDEIRAEYSNDNSWDRYDRWLGYLSDPDRPLHPAVEYHLKENIRAEFWEYNARQDASEEEDDEANMDADPEEEFRTIAEGVNPQQNEIDLKDTLVQLKQILVDLKELPEHEQSDDEIELESEVNATIAQLNAKLNTSPENSLKLHLDNIGWSEGHMITMERKARRAMTLEGRYPKKVEDEDDLVSDQDNEIPVQRVGIPGLDTEWIIDVEDLNEPEDTNTRWPLAVEEQVRDLIIKDEDVEQSDHDSLLDIVKPEVAVRRDLIAQELERTETSQVARDQRLSDQQLEKINQRRLNKLFKLGEEYQTKQ